MIDAMIGRRLGPCFLIAALFMVASLMACGARSSIGTAGNASNDAAMDTVWPVKDVAIPDRRPSDRFNWPDAPTDFFVWPEVYAGTPFGCRSDADCFGERCCRTPWGVNLCNATCWP